MDNLTHSLFGALLGASAARTQKNTEKRVRAAAIWTSVIGSNLPDIDPVLPWLSGDRVHKLAYIVHHRGYTHTLLLAPILGLLAAFIGKKIGKVKGRAFDPVFNRLWLLGAVAVLLHVCADACNDYGVHPFSPFYNHWFYGGILFIVEPLLLITLLPFAFELTAKSRWRYVWIGFSAVLAALVWSGKFVPVGMAIAFTLWGARSWFLQLRMPGPRAAWRGLAVVMAVFVAASISAHEAVDRVMRDKAPAERVVQRAVSPSPGNPICWRTVVVTDGPGDWYRVRVGGLSLVPGFYSPESCFKAWKSEHTVPMRAASIPAADMLEWAGEFQGSARELRALAASDCEVGAFLRFSRAPYWKKAGGYWIVGDVRYDREEQLGFAEFQTRAASKDCLRWLPPWEPPISPVLSRTDGAGSGTN